MKYRVIAIISALVAVGQLYSEQVEEGDVRMGVASFQYQSVKAYADDHHGRLPPATEGQALVEGFTPPLIYNASLAGRLWQGIPRDTWILKTREPYLESTYYFVRGADDEWGELRWKARPNLNLWLFWNAGGFTAILSLGLGGLALLEWRLKRILAC